MMFPKPERVEDEDYKNWIRTLPCEACEQKPSICHHVYAGGMSTKCSDRDTIPLCHDHHTGGKDAVHQIGKKTFALKFNIDYASVIERLNKKYESEKNDL